MRDILVHGAVKFTSTSEELKDQLLEGYVDRADVRDVHLLGDLGRLVLLQDLLPDDARYGEALLLLAHELAGANRLAVETRRVLIQHFVYRRDLDMVERLLDESPDIDAEFYGYLRAECLNPFTDPKRDAHNDWLRNFNRFFTEHGLAQIYFESSDGEPFDHIRTDLPSQTVGTNANDPLVSVVLTTYRPVESKLHSSVKSILEQTWANLELLIVDDASGPEYQEILNRIQSLDARVRIIHAEENRGTYVARNLGYAASRGEFITGQDDDDWSHPQRLERQIAFMRRKPQTAACRIMAIRCDENMSRTRLGYRPVVFNPSSLMIRRSVYERIGDHLYSRKGADSEYYFRIKAVTGGQVANIEEPLSIIRILPESLSRGDFSAGWRHPARSSFRSAYRHWHRNTSVDELKVAGGDVPVKIPHRYSVFESPAKVRELDVLFAGDWQRYGGPQKSMLEEIAALRASGYRVGVMNLEAARFMSEGATGSLNDEVQELINSNAIEEIFYDDADVHVRLMVLRYPPILQFMTHEPSELQIDRMIIVANQAPAELDGSDIRYIVNDCHVNAKATFGVVPRWVPQGPQVRDFLTHYLDGAILTDFDMPGILDVGQWWRDRLWYRSTVPVIGRHSRDDRMKWPAEKHLLEKIYPTNGEYDVRIMGGHRVPLRVLGTRRVPTAWTVYKKDEMSVPEFLHTLDYFVFYQHPQAVEAFGRAILEALAAGVVVILPKHFERVFGTAAIYADIDEIDVSIQKLHSDFSKYREQLERSRKVLEERFSYSAYRQLIERLLTGSF